VLGPMLAWVVAVCFGLCERGCGRVLWPMLASERGVWAKTTTKK
jgi:hypothetical protein